MGIWLWVAAYVLGMVVVQVLVYRYRNRPDAGSRVSSFAGTDPVDGRWTDSEARGGNGNAGATEGRRCPHCGARNEAEGAFEFCRRCAGQLDG